MKNITYHPLDAFTPEEYLPVLNDKALRAHLIAHDLFDQDSVTAWLLDKTQQDQASNCRIRAIALKGQLVGWGGIQEEAGCHELALVLVPAAWGIGMRVYREMMLWAKDMGLNTVVIHLLETRPVYGFLKRKASKMSQTQILGRLFNTYYLDLAAL